MSAFAASSFKFEPTWTMILDYARMRDDNSIIWLKQQLSIIDPENIVTSMVYKAYLIASDLASDSSAEYRKTVLPFFKEQFETLPEDSEHRPYCAVLLHYCYASAAVNPVTEEEKSWGPMAAWSKSIEPLQYAASKDLAHAYYRMGDTASSGLISEPEDGHYYKLGAMLNHIPCYMALGSFYEHNVFNKNIDEAKRYYTLAADAGYDRAKEMLNSFETENEHDAAAYDDGEEDEDTKERKAIAAQCKAEADQAIESVIVYDVRFDFASSWPIFEAMLSGNSKAAEHVNNAITEVESALKENPADRCLLVKEMVLKAYFMAANIDKRDRPVRDKVFPFLYEVAIDLPTSPQEASYRYKTFNPDRKFYAILLFYCYHPDWRFPAQYEKDRSTDGYTASQFLEMALDQDSETIAAATLPLDELAKLSQGHAHCALAKSLLNGTNFESPDEAGGLVHLKKAAEEFEYPEACYLLAQAYQSGSYDLDTDVEEAKRCYRLGAKAATTDGLLSNSYVSFCLTGIASIHYEADEHAEALHWYDESARLTNDLDSWYMLGMAYLDDTGYLSKCVATKDPAKAEAYLLHAASAGHGQAQLSLGDYYVHTANKIADGLQWITAAAEQGAWGANAKLDDLREKGLC
jgi:TPR repeat protein